MIYKHFLSIGIFLGKFNEILVFGQFIRPVAIVFAKNIRKGDRRNREVTKKNQFPTIGRLDR